MGRQVVLVSEAEGLRVCLECSATLGRGEDEAAWMAVHLGGADGTGVCDLAHASAEDGG